MKARFTTDARHEQWIKPLKELPKKRMPHDLFCFATRYLVEEARAIGLPDETLIQDLPEWLTIEHLLDTGNQVSHGVFIALAERLKEARGDPSPYKLRTAAYRAAGFDDWVTNMVRRGGSVAFAIWFTSFMGNLVTNDQHVKATETGRDENGTRRGRTIHYYLKPEDKTYVEQGTFARGYYEILTLLWPVTADAPLVAVRDVALRFSPEKLLRDEFDYARRGLGIQDIERDQEGNLRFDGEKVGVAVSRDALDSKWQFNKNFVRYPSHPVQMTRPIVFNGEEIFSEGLILDAPASIYEWEYKKLPPVNRLQVFIQGMHDRFFVSTKHVLASYARVSTERDRANERGEEAERQRALAEARSKELEQRIAGDAHERRNALGRMHQRALVVLNYLRGNGAPERMIDYAELIACEAILLREKGEGVHGLYTSGNASTERVNLVQVIEDCGLLFAKDKTNDRVNGRFEADGDYYVEIIRGTGSCVIENLMTNAARAMDWVGDLEITLYRETRETPSGPVAGIVLSVSDTGIGMDEETIRKYKEGTLDRGSEERQGTGHKIVGLFARKHNPNIPDNGLSIESTPGKGTTISLFIPERYQTTKQTG